MLRCSNGKYNNGAVLKEIDFHGHAETVGNPSAVSCKRKASDDISVRPSKIIRSTIASDVSGVASESLTIRDVVKFRAVMHIVGYKQRMKHYRTLPHCLKQYNVASDAYDNSC